VELFRAMSLENNSLLLEYNISLQVKMNVKVGSRSSGYCSRSDLSSSGVRRSKTWAALVSSVILFFGKYAVIDCRNVFFVVDQRI
jgi:hypothetical protein